MNERDVAAVGKPEEDEPAAATMTMRMRLTSVAVAVASVGAGGVAVFETENEVGTGTLLAIGAYFVIAVILGRFPRLKLGENEIDPSEVRKATRKSEAAIQKAGRAQAQAAANSTELEKAKAEVEQARAEVEMARAEAEAARVEAEEAKEGYVLRQQGPAENWAMDYEPQLDERLAALAADYQAVRTTMSSGPARTEKMTQIIESMISACRDPGFDSLDYVSLLSSSDRGLQLVGIAYVHARPEAEAVMPLAELALKADKPFSEYWAARTLRAILRDRCYLLVPSLRSRIESRLSQLPHGTDRARELRGILDNCP